ncbi:uncharacterized protein LOC132266995 [Cornus florida]|uniref:uncharacterized protein LOC132266995 n=1 Tax=Cornus florida TaxID=4283 RepID=UPI0028A02A64|nr:uncharacterized protein LOC132266995 [Cornus florida]
MQRRPEQRAPQQQQQQRAPQQQQQKKRKRQEQQQGSPQQPQQEKKPKMHAPYLAPKSILKFSRCSFEHLVKKKLQQLSHEEQTQKKSKKHERIDLEKIIVISDILFEDFPDAVGKTFHELGLIYFRANNNERMLLKAELEEDPYKLGELSVESLFDLNLPDGKWWITLTFDSFVFSWGYCNGCSWVHTHPEKLLSYYLHVEEQI